MKTLFKDTIGLVLSETLEEDGAPVNLTSSTVTFKLYSAQDDTLKWSHTGTVDVAANGTCHYTTVSGDLDTVGTYYLTIHVVWVAGTVKDYQGEYYEVISGAETLVTRPEQLEFMNIPSENAIGDNSLDSYLQEANALVELSIPVLATTTNQNYIRLKKTLVKLKAGILYFMNLDEGSGINPNLRLEKIRLWQDEYNLAVENLNNSLATTSTGSGVVRRVKNSCYSDPSSPYYEG